MLKIRDYSRLPSRSAAVAALAAGLFFTALGAADAQQLTPVKAQLAWLPGAANVGEFVALEKGYYRDAGLNVEILIGGPGLQPVLQVATGAAVVGVLPSSIHALQAISEDIPLEVVAVGLQKHPAAMYSMKSSNITTGDDLKGKIIGEQGGVLTKVFLAVYGLSEDDVTLVNIGNSLDAVALGRVDAAIGWETSRQQRASFGGNYNALRLADTKATMSANVYFTMQETLEKDPELLTRYLDATKKGWDYARENQEEAISALLKHNPALNRDLESQDLEEVLAYAYAGSASWGTTSVEDWRTQIEMLDSLKVFKGKVPVADEVLATLPGNPFVKDE